MELFPDGAHVRLRSKVHGTYLHADEDGVGVSLRPVRASMNVAWKVHRIERNGVPLLLLYGAAYGRYLASTIDPAPFGRAGQRVVQGVYDDLGDTTVMWNPSRVASGTDGEILLQSVCYLRLLRANGKHFKWWRNIVSVDSYFNRSTMMNWVVELIPPLPQPPSFPPPPVHPAPGAFGRRGIIALYRPRTRPPVRTIRCVHADPNGNFDDQGWRTFEFRGRFAFNLRFIVARHFNHSFFFFNLTVCARPGRYARLTPLIGDLPLNEEPMEVIAVNNGTPVEAALRYPNLEAP